MKKRKEDPKKNKSLLTFFVNTKDSVVSVIEKLTWEQLKKLQNGKR